MQDGVDPCVNTNRPLTHSLDLTKEGLMPIVQCSVPGCDRTVKARGWCSMHYGRWQRDGDPGEAATRKPEWDLSVEDRFWRKVQKTATCWPWTGAINSKGYGTFQLPRNGAKRAPHVYAHRYSYRLAIGPIPAGAVIDHLCHTPACVNPAHLRAVTPSQNEENRRGASSNSRTGIRNVYPLPDGRYTVQVRHRHIGNFVDLAEAEKAAIQARLEIMSASDMHLRAEVSGEAL